MTRDGICGVGNSATLVSAIAACLAAALAGVNLLVLPRRERVRWAREALVEAFVEFLSATYATKDACRDAVKARRAGAARGDEEIVRLYEMMIASRDQELAHITRLRLLASRRVMDAAFGLRDVEGPLTRNPHVRWFPVDARLGASCTGGTS
ncbi:MAG TPA: hypothetical protein VFR46_09400 [Actinomycetes bacterium]|nr:hypothetical protein [Actinomycetes bacterium]